MAEIKKNVLTQEGLKRYEEELQDLRVNKRKEIADKIKEAREQGDLSENAEYDAAKDEQRDIEARIGELEELLKHAEVYVSEETPIDRVGIGSLVKVLDIEEDEELNLKITAEDCPDGINSPTVYTTQAAQRPKMDYNSASPSPERFPTSLRSAQSCSARKRARWSR